MDPAVAHRLVAEEGAAALAAAHEVPDPGSLAAASALRKMVDPPLAAAALTQVALRRRAVAKFGDRAGSLFLTSDGLEQATRPAVARWRAARLVTAGVADVIDLGCGIGADALAMIEAGLDVVAVERDETTAILAAANLGDRGVVLQADATTVELGARTVFCDPARRTSAGRTWNVADFSPSWDFALGLLGRPQGSCLKLGPGLPRRLVPRNALTEWVSHAGDAVEACVWSSRFGPPERAAILLPEEHRLAVGESAIPTGPVGRYLHEPDPAVLAAGGLSALAVATGARRLHPDIAYLVTDDLVESPFWTSFDVLDRLPWREKSMRKWAHDNAIGTLEIKKRGIDVDPAALRRRLRLTGPNSATIVITPTMASAEVLVVRRRARRLGWVSEQGEDADGYPEHDARERSARDSGSGDGGPRGARTRGG